MPAADRRRDGGTRSKQKLRAWEGKLMKVSIFIGKKEWNPASDDVFRTWRQSCPSVPPAIYPRQTKLTNGGNLFLRHSQVGQGSTAQLEACLPRSKPHHIQRDLLPGKCLQDHSQGRRVIVSMTCGMGFPPNPFLNVFRRVEDPP